MASSRRGSSSMIRRSSVKPASNSFPGAPLRTTSVAQEARKVRKETELIDNEDGKKKPLASNRSIPSRDAKLQSYRRGSRSSFVNGSVLATDSNAQSCRGGSSGSSENLTSLRGRSCRKPPMSSSRLKRETVGLAAAKGEQQRGKYLSKLTGGSERNVPASLLPTPSSDLSSGLLVADHDFDPELVRGTAYEESLIDLNLLPTILSSDGPIIPSVFTPERTKTTTMEMEGFCTFDGSRISPIEEASLVLNQSIPEVCASVACKGPGTALKHIDHVDTMQMRSTRGVGVTEKCELQNAIEEQHVCRNPSIQNDLDSCLQPRHYCLQHPECGSIASNILTLDLEALDPGRNSNEMRWHTFEEEANMIADQLAAWAISGGDKCIPEASVRYCKTSAHNDEKSLKHLESSQAVICLDSNEETSSSLPFEPSLMQLEAEFGCKTSEGLTAGSDQEPLFWPLSPNSYWRDDNNIKSSPCKVYSEGNLKGGEKIKSRKAINLSGSGKYQLQRGKQSSSEGKLSTLAVGSMLHRKSGVFFCDSPKHVDSKPSVRFQCDLSKREFGSPSRTILKSNKSNLKPTGQSRREYGLVSKNKTMDFKGEVKIHSREFPSRNKVSKLDWSPISSSDTRGSTIQKGMEVLSLVSSEMSLDSTGRWCDENNGGCLGIFDVKNEGKLPCSASSMDHLCNQIDEMQDVHLRAFSETDSCISSCNFVCNKESDIIQMLDIFKLSDSMECFENNFLVPGCEDGNRDGHFEKSDSKSKEDELSSSPSSIDHFCDQADKIQDGHLRSYSETDNHTSSQGVVYNKKSGNLQMFDLSRLPDSLQSFENDLVAADCENPTEDDAGDKNLCLRGSEGLWFWESSSCPGYSDGSKLVDDGLNLTTDHFSFYNLYWQTRFLHSIEDSIEVLVGMEEFDGQEGIEAARNEGLFSFCTSGGMGAILSSVDCPAVQNDIVPKNALSPNANGSGESISSQFLKNNAVLLGIDTGLDLSLFSHTKTTASSGSSLFPPTPTETITFGTSNVFQQGEGVFLSCSGYEIVPPSCKFDLQKCKMEKRAPGTKGCSIQDYRQSKGTIEIDSVLEGIFHYCMDFDRWWGSSLLRVNAEQNLIMPWDNGLLRRRYFLQNSGAECNRKCAEQRSICTQHLSHQQIEVKEGKVPCYPISQISGNDEIIVDREEFSAIESIVVIKSSVGSCGQELETASERIKIFLLDWDQGNEDNMSNVMCETGLVTRLCENCVSEHEHPNCADIFLEDPRPSGVIETGAMYEFHNWIEPGEEDGVNNLKCESSDWLFASINKRSGKVGFSLVPYFSDQVVSVLCWTSELICWTSELISEQDSAVIFSDSMFLIRRTYSKDHVYSDVRGCASVKFSMVEGDFSSIGLLDGTPIQIGEFTNWSPYGAEKHIVELKNLWRKGQEPILGNITVTMRKIEENFRAHVKRTTFALNFPVCILIYKNPLWLDYCSSEQDCGVLSIRWYEDKQVVEHLSKDKLDITLELLDSNAAFLSHLENIGNMTAKNNECYMTQESDLLARQLLDDSLLEIGDVEEFLTDWEFVNNVKQIPKTDVGGCASVKCSM